MVGTGGQSQKFITEFRCHSCVVEGKLPDIVIEIPELLFRVCLEEVVVLKYNIRSIIDLTVKYRDHLISIYYNISNHMFTSDKAYSLFRKNVISLFKKLRKTCAFHVEISRKRVIL